MRAVPMGNCPTIYGPVQSRRHGQSLGINLGLTDRKLCTWGCIYCQCGMGERGRPTRQEGVPSAKDVLTVLSQRLDELHCLDSVTFAGNTEPTVHPEFLDMVIAIQKFKIERGFKWTLNALSNGSELAREEVLRACNLLDEIWVKLDCADTHMFHRLNRPLPEISTLADHLQRIKTLKAPRLQTLLWKHESDIRLSNFTETNLSSLLDAYCWLRPVEVHITTVSRQTALSGILPVETIELNEFAAKARAWGVSAQAFGSN